MGCHSILRRKTHLDSVEPETNLTDQLRGGWAFRDSECRRDQEPL